MINKPYPVVILAGGLATRLHPITETIPKSMIPIHGEPFIAHQLRLLKKNRIERVIMCLGFLGEQIINYIGNGQQFGLDVTYTHDGPTLLGTAGAIKNALSLVNNRFFVLYGDSYLLCPFLAIQKAFDKQHSSALMTIFKNNGQWDHSNVEFHHGIINAYDKIHRTANMHYIDYGLGLFDSSVFARIPDGIPYDLATVYQELLKENKLDAYVVSDRFYEIGSFTGINELENYITPKESAWNLSINS